VGLSFVEYWVAAELQPLGPGRHHGQDSRDVHEDKRYSLDRGRFHTRFFGEENKEQDFGAVNYEQQF
jgi:hypothetical protein